MNVDTRASRKNKRRALKRQENRKSLNTSDFDSIAHAQPTPQHQTNNKKTVNVDMSNMAIIFEAPPYLCDLFVEAGIKSDFEEQERIIEQMRIEVAKGNKNPNPPKAVIELFNSLANAEITVTTSEDGEDTYMEIRDKEYIPVEGDDRCSLLLCGITDVRTVDEKAGTAVVAYDSSVGEKYVTLPIEKVMSSKEIEEWYGNS